MTKLNNITTIETFLNTEVANFASYNSLRSLASLVDGFKNAQRKVIWGMRNKPSGKDFKVSTLAGEIQVACLEYDTLIQLEDDTQIKIGDWATKFPNKKLNVKSVNEKGQNVIAVGHSARLTKKTKELLEVTIDDKIIRCTEEHLFLVKKDKLEWVEAHLLEEGDEIISYK